MPACAPSSSLNGTAFLLADYGAILAFFLLGAVDRRGHADLLSDEKFQIIASAPSACCSCCGLWDGRWLPPPPSGLCWASSWC
ncbi:MAG: hypothetical protein ACLSUM_03710 [Dysosmobacter welbionis]